jgi:hypothetical protein
MGVSSPIKMGCLVDGSKEEKLYFEESIWCQALESKILVLGEEEI